MTVQPEKIFTSGQKDAELKRLQDEKNQRYADENRFIINAVKDGSKNYSEIARNCATTPAAIISKTKKLMRLGFIEDCDRTSYKPTLTR